MSRFWQLVCFLFLSSPCLMAANAKVVMGLSRPPYIDAEARKGVVIELANLVFNDMKITPDYQFASNKRMEDLLLKKQVDIAVEVTPFSSALFYSDTFITYKNFVVLRKKLHREIRSYQDLQGLSVCGWQNARRDLGAGFAEATLAFASYQEYPEQSRQVTAFLKELCQVIIVDEFILKSYWSEALKRGAVQLSKDEVEWIPTPTAHANNFVVGFHDHVLRDRFNESLRRIKTTKAWSENLSSFNNKFLKTGSH